MTASLDDRARPMGSEEHILEVAMVESLGLETPNLEVPGNIQDLTQ